MERRPDTPPQDQREVREICISLTSLLNKGQDRDEIKKLFLDLPLDKQGIVFEEAIREDQYQIVNTLVKYMVVDISHINLAMDNILDNVHLNLIFDVLIRHILNKNRNSMTTQEWNSLLLRAIKRNAVYISYVAVINGANNLSMAYLGAKLFGSKKIQQLLLKKGGKEILSSRSRSFKDSSQYDKLDISSERINLLLNLLTAMMGDDPTLTDTYIKEVGCMGAEDFIIVFRSLEKYKDKSDDKALALDIYTSFLDDFHNSDQEVQYDVINYLIYPIATSSQDLDKLRSIYSKMFY